jgi:type II secretory ATPase GspE/PulE/Tfp pilus assembly ATPase PilB-like protein
MEHIHFPTLAKALDSPSPPNVLAALLVDAAALEASDVHIIPQCDASLIRVRVGGVMLADLRLAQSLAWSCVQRIKVLAGLRTDVAHHAQDGAFTDGGVGVRVACMPSVWGERVTLRLSCAELPSLSPNVLGLAGGLLVSPGLALVCGAPGSGKTTVLYGLASLYAFQDRTVHTIEDPVERLVAGLCQSSVTETFGFGEAIRASLRHDPQVLVVGEVRDSETVAMALRAAETGVLVLATVHARSTHGCISRLQSLGASTDAVRSVLRACMLVSVGTDRVRNFQALEITDSFWQEMLL